MPLSDEQVAKFLKRKLPRDVVSHFILPIISYDHLCFKSEDEILLFQPTGYPFNIGFLSALKWRRIKLSVSTVNARLAMSDQWRATDSKIKEYSAKYKDGNKLEPPILIDTKESDIGYVLMDGVHRFAALKKLDVKRHVFWVGTVVQPSICQKWIKIGIVHCCAIFQFSWLKLLRKLKLERERK